MRLGESGDPVRLERREDIGIIVIDNPPINAGSGAVRRGLLSAIEEVTVDPAIKGCVIIGAQNMFMAGSDIREFASPLEEPQLPSIISAIESCPKIFAAAIAGAALGGGFELALGCDLRIATPDAVVGLPETTLGIMPGAGGTQRLPRLVEQAKALELICNGTRVKATEAATLGMIDAVSSSQLLRDAMGMVRSAQSKRRVLELPVRISATPAFEKAKAAAIRSGKGRPHILAAIAAVEGCGQPSTVDALRREREVFQELRMSREAAALRHLFFAERTNAKIPALQGVKPRAVATAAVIGGGTMGSGIACALLDGRKKVSIFEQTSELAALARQRVEKNLRSRLDRGRLTLDMLDEMLTRFSVTTSLADVASSDVIIEAVFEDFKVKREVFAKLGGIAKSSCVLLTNTSYLSVSDIAEASGRPMNVAGMHFFSPADVMKLVEIVSHAKVEPEVLATAYALAKDCSKLPILAKDSFGFVGNRIYAAYRRQCEFMLEEGALPEQIDAALEAFGFAMGPFAVADMSGLDIAWNMRKSTASTRDPSARYVAIPDLLCEMGRFGRKSGAGYYRYEDGRRQVDPEVTALIEKASSASGFARKTFKDDEIVDRVLSAMASEAALLIEEGVANTPTDVDLVLTNGYGFPRHEGGPLFWARRRPLNEIEQSFARLRQASGKGFRLGQISVLRDEVSG